MDGNAVLDRCPVGCPGQLAPAGIELSEGPLLRCGRCGHLVFAQTGEAYRRSIATFDNPEAVAVWSRTTPRFRRRSRRTLDTARRLLGRPAGPLRLLDVGCATGNFVAEAARWGARAEGVEPMAAPARAARDAGLEVICGRLEEAAFPDGRFDVVTLFEVIEHLPDPLALLTEARRILRPGGLMIVRTGNAESWTVRFMGPRWDYFCPAIGHISFFTPRSMRLAAERTGFDVARTRYHSVAICRPEDVSPLRYRLAKIAAELLNWPSRLAGRSHEMEVYLRARR